MKRHTTLNIEDDLLVEAKEKNLNVSELTEEALRDALHKQTIVVDKPKTCEFCNKPGELTLLWPDEKWICFNCLKSKSMKITHGG